MFICWFESEADVHLVFANLNGDWPHLKSSLPETLCMSSKSCRNIENLVFKNDMIVPKPFSNDTWSLHNFLIKRMFIVGLPPHAALSSNHIHVLHAWLEAIHLPPISVDAIDTSIHVVEPIVQICHILIRKDHFILPTHNLARIRSNSPPLDDVFVL